MKSVLRPEESVARLDAAAVQWEHEVPDLDSSVFQTVSLITLIGVAIENEFRTFAQSELNLSPGDMRILLALRRSSPSYTRSPVQLEKTLLVTSGAITKQIARLEARELVERLDHEVGRRGFQVRLSEKGRELLDAVLSKRQHSAYPTLAEALHALSEDEQRNGLRFLRRLMGNLEPRRARKRVREKALQWPQASTEP